MAHPSLTTLPTEILSQICNFLYDSHIPSLAAFSLANKHCFAIAAPVLVDITTFIIFKPAQLSQDVDACKHSLRRHQLDLFQHVRRLVIVGRMRRLDNPWNTTGFGGTNPNGFEESEYSDSEDDAPLDYKKNRPTWHFALPTTTSWEATRARLHGFQFGSDHGRGDSPAFWNDGDRVPASAAYDADHQWQPLADLVSQLPGLADVVYRCPSQFPPCLLKAIHADSMSRQIRLHLHTFRLRSAYDGSAAIDRHEWELITSPRLSSIWLQHRMRRVKGGVRGEEQLPSRPLDAVLWMVKQGPLSSCLRSMNVSGSTSAEHDAPSPIPASENFTANFSVHFPRAVTD
ncbi:hypothetical protein N658DRAFT_213218 [Parathielavia hyrcaniae]|uniref:F-box domain-containing protein n=1 Tax=Parathielavia hyrcaniae TaxID=113614 RepID=A0AAN6PVF2_9PEZI|nr:hypothetical protein N658DRAFT_213218 [Parathielavia hyrcaniae]